MGTEGSNALGSFKNLSLKSVPISVKVTGAELNPKAV